MLLGGLVDQPVTGGVFNTSTNAGRDAPKTLFFVQHAFGATRVIDNAVIWVDQCFWGGSELLKCGASFEV